MPEITSIHNPKIQHLRALMQKRSLREQEHLFVVEGVRLAEEALLHGPQPVEVYYASSISDRAKDLMSRFVENGAQVTEVADDLMQRLSETESSQGVVLVMPITARPLSIDLNFVLILDQIKDPGNAGTMLRTAAASGVQLVIATPGTADLYSPKVVRAGMGAHFRLALLDQSWDQISVLCREREKSVKLLTASADAGQAFWQVDLRQPIALIIGSEAEGVSADARRHADGAIRIPMPGNFESLNAAVAAGILLFEVVHQRMP